MLTSLLFDEAGSSGVDNFASTAARLSNKKVLWVNVQGTEDTELQEVESVFSISNEATRQARSANPEPQVRLEDEYIYVRVLFPPDEDVSGRAQALHCYVGRNWLVTNYESSNAIVDEFRDLTSGAGEIGGLHAMSLLATLLELVIVGYSEAFEQIEEGLEDFDEKVLASTDRDIDSKVTMLVRSRARVGQLRRTLAPHRRVFTTLSHTELDLVSTERSASRFSNLAGQVSDALNGARDAREAVVSSFDMLILRTEHRTNEIVKVLTLASILLLPGALIAAVMGMNVNLATSEFVTSNLFWGSLALMATVAVGTLVLAKSRRWI